MTATLRVLDAIQSALDERHPAIVLDGEDEERRLHEGAPDAPFEKHFPAVAGEDFAASHAAEDWLSERGYSLGSMQGDAPRGIMLGDYQIAKWRNLTATERSDLDGTLVCVTGSPRNGSLVVRLKVAPVSP